MFSRSEVARMGAIARNKKQGEKSREEYLRNPKLCEFCNNPIPLVEGKYVYEIRAKKYCSPKCGGLARTKPKKLKDKIQREKKFMSSENFTITNMTKEEVFSRYEKWQTARSSIRKHGERVMRESGKEKICRNCGYNKHVEICHIKSVSSFSGDSYIYEINSLDNLVFLCCNCHWEFDNGILDLN